MSVSFECIIGVAKQSKMKQLNKMNVGGYSKIEKKTEKKKKEIKSL